MLAWRTAEHEVTIQDELRATLTNTPCRRDERLLVLVDLRDHLCRVPRRLAPFFADELAGCSVEQAKLLAGRLGCKGFPCAVDTSHKDGHLGSSARPNCLPTLRSSAELR